MDSLKIIVFCGPSGSGKTSIVKALLSIMPELEFSISATTRKRRNNEVEGVDYYFMSPKQFKSNINSAAFIEHEEVYKNVCYGTLWKEIDRISNTGKIPILDIDVNGALNIRKKYRDASHIFFVHPGNEEILRNRLKKRHTENDEAIAKRMERAVRELTFSEKFDYIIYNDSDLQLSVNSSREIIEKIIQTNI
ncbi:MAG: guanylate kinase [Bacteroidetes bacterium]|nr:guanylate kinase [Bacteroidota bacterium]